MLVSMITFVYTPEFKKRLETFPKKIRLKVFVRLIVFIKDPFDPILNNHSLHGIYAGRRSINVTGDIRIVYREINENRYLLTDVGTHSQLYE
jgi:addiction module RelE/StbE family toxin